MARHGNYKELQHKFRQQRKHSRSLNDLYGKNIWNGYEPEKDENYWSFQVSESLQENTVKLLKIQTPKRINHIENSKFFKPAPIAQ